MRVLFVAADLPHPPFTGSHTRPLSIIRALVTAGHEVIAVGALPEDDRTSDADGCDIQADRPGSRLAAPEADLLHELCAEVVALPAGLTRTTRRSVLSGGRKLLSPVPLIGRGYNQVIGERVTEAIERTRPDVMQLETMYAVHYAGQANRSASAGASGAAPAAVPVVLDLTDVVSGLCEAAAHAHALRYAAARLQAASSRRQERRLLRGVIPMTINDEDRDRLARLGILAYTVPLAIDMPALRQAEFADPGAADVPLELLFVGSLLHAPNLAAARFLVDELVPELERRGVRFRLTVAGRAASPEHLRRSRSSLRQGRPPSFGDPSEQPVEFVPDVPDLAPLYRRADIVLVPLPFGGGTKNKTLEAMAWGRPVVGTSQAFTGLGPAARTACVETGYSASAMANAILALAAQPRRRAEMGRAGREYVAAHHSQELVNRRVQVLYDAVSRGGAVTAAEALWGRSCASQQRDQSK